MIRLRALARQAIGRSVDLVLGVETDEDIDYDGLEFDADRGISYYATSWLRLVPLYRMLRGLRIGTQDVFLDLGCGKGRVLLVASRFRFHRLIGVDLSPSLLAVAAANLERTRLNVAADRVELVESDAGDYEIPDDVTMIYLFNPFSGPVFEAMLDHVISSVRRRPRTIRLLYLNEVGRAELLRRGFTAMGRTGGVALYVLDGRAEPA